MPATRGDGPDATSVLAAALDAARGGGADEASARIEEIRTQVLVLRDGVPETTLDRTQRGLGVRVVADGSTGFAATVERSNDAAADAARGAVEGARLVAGARSARFELVAEPGHGDVVHTSTYRVDPTEVPLEE